MVDEVIDRNKDMKEIFGIPITPSDKKVIDESFKEWTKVNKETGTSKIEEALQSDDDLLYKVVAIITQGELGLKGKISDLKESIKDSVIEKLGIKPENTGGGTSEQPLTVDPSILV